MTQSLLALSAADRDAATVAQKIAVTTTREHAASVDSEARFPAESISALAKAGLLGLTLPTEFGGMGLGMPAFAAITETLAQECASTAMIYVMHGVASQALAQSTHLARKSEVLRDISSGRHLTTLAFSESGSRSHFWAPVSTLTPSGDGYLVNAKKSWVTSALTADSFVAVSLAQPTGASQPGLTAYLVDRKAPGVHVGKSFDGLGLKGNDSVPVVFENLKISDSSLLTEPAASTDLVLGVVLPWFAVGTSAMAHGLCERSLALTSQHLMSQSFEHLGISLRDLPILRARYAEMLTRTTASRALLGIALDRIQNGDAGAALYVLQARLDALEGVLQVTDLAMKACGGVAFSKHLPVERAFRDARAGWVMAPTADHLREFIGRLALGLPLFGN